MKKFCLFISLFLIFSLFGSTLSVIPGFRVCSIEIPGSGRAGVKYRKAGSEVWLNAPELVEVEEEKVLRGSLLDLEENTGYELEVSVGSRIYRSAFKTRNTDFTIAKTVYLTKKDCGKTFKPQSGTPEGYIRYTAGPGFVFDSGRHAGIAILIDKAQYIILDGLTVRGGKFNAVRVRDSKHIRIMNCDISGFGQGGVFRPDLDGKYYNSKNKAIWHDAGIGVRDCDDVIIERNYIHDPATPGNSWYYSHPAGSDGIFIGNTKRAVIRYNDIVGSDKFRWNDAIAGDCKNFSVTGGPSEDAEICGNYFAFGNDDSVELDGGQKNCRFFFNRIEGFYCGVSVAAIRRGPSYIFCNSITRPGDEFGLRGVAVKALCNTNVPWGMGFFYRNSAQGRPFGYPRMAGDYTAPRFTFRENIYPDSPYASMYSEFKEKNYTVDLNDKLNAPEGVPAYPAALPVRTGVLSQDKDTLTFDHSRSMQPQKVAVSYSGSKTLRYKVMVCEATDHFAVSPSTGTLEPGMSVTLTVTPQRSRAARLNSGAFVFRLEDGSSIPVSVYVDARKDAALVRKTLEKLIPGTITGNGSDFLMDFELPEDGNYVLFVRKADGCASRIEVVLPGAEPQTRRLKLNDERHKWDVPALEKDSNPPFVLKKGKCRIVIRKSRRSSKVPAVTGAYLCRDWHTVLPLLRELDNLLKMYGK